MAKGVFLFYNSLPTAMSEAFAIQKWRFCRWLLLWQLLQSSQLETMPPSACDLFHPTVEFQDPICVPLRAVQDDFHSYTWKGLHMCISEGVSPCLCRRWTFCWTTWSDKRIRLVLQKTGDLDDVKALASLLQDYNLWVGHTVPGYRAFYIEENSIRRKLSNQSCAFDARIKKIEQTKDRDRELWCSTSHTNQTHAMASLSNNKRIRSTALEDTAVSPTFVLQPNEYDIISVRGFGKSRQSLKKFR